MGIGGDSLQIITLLSVGIASSAIGILGLVVYFSDRTSVTHKTFLIFSLGAIGWSIFNYLTFQPATEFFALWYLRFQMFFAVIYSFYFFRLFYVFPERIIKNSKFYSYVVVPTVTAVAILTLSPLIFTNITQLSGEGRVETVANGPMLPVFGMVVIALIISGITILFKKIRKAAPNKKIQLKYVLFGAVITFSLHIVFNFLMPAIFGDTSFAPFGAVFIFPFIVLTSYAIIKYQFLNIKVLLAEITVAALVIVNVGQLFTANNTRDIIFRSVTLSLVTALGYLLVRSVQNEVKRREEVERLAKEKTEAFDELEERNRNLATLQKISGIVLNENDMKAMSQKILDELPNQLENNVGAMLSIVKNGHLEGYGMTSSNFSKKVMSLVGGNLSKHSHPIKREFNLIHRAIVDRESTSSSKLADFISPPISKPIAVSIQKLIGAKHFEAFPLVAGGEPFGVILFAFNKAEGEIHSKNYSIAKAISDDMSLAIQRAQAFVQLKEANEYLSQLDKMKDEFISMASHELNTPLAAIEGYLSMILDEGMGKVDKQSRTYLNRAYASSKRLAELILDLLNVSRIEQGRLKMKYSKVSLSELAQSVIHELQIKADEKKIYLKLKADKNVPETWCDPDRIREVIVNLTGNALKFTDKGGVTIKIKKADKKIVVEVVDTGRGIAKADQSKLFHKFSQVKREVDEHQGTGLGLYISKNFVELHKGKIWIESDAGKGSTFSFEIPVITKPPKEVEGAILEKSVKSTQIETPKKGDVPKIITDSAKGDT